MRQGDKFETSFCFLKKLYLNTSGLQLVSISFDRPQLAKQ